MGGGGGGGRSESIFMLISTDTLIFLLFPDQILGGRKTASGGAPPWMKTSWSTLAHF